jgi:hypothetical protein
MAVARRRRECHSLRLVPAQRGGGEGLVPRHASWGARLVVSKGNTAKRKCSKQGWERSHTNCRVTRRDTMVARRTAVIDLREITASHRAGRSPSTKTNSQNFVFSTDGSTTMDLICSRRRPVPSCKWKEATERGRRVLSRSYQKEWQGGERKRRMTETDSPLASGWRS